MKRIISNMHYFFVWGKHPALAASEVLSAIKRLNMKAHMVDSSVEAGIINVHGVLTHEFMEQLGGTIKFGMVRIRLDKHAKKETIVKAIAGTIPEGGHRKVVFGINQYRAHNLRKIFSKSEMQRIGKLVKDTLKRKRPVRWVVSRERTLSSVVVSKNKLIEKGGEFVLLHGKNELWIGTSLAVQPFEEYSIRDYGRISVDPVSGMLPPKLAHIMLNISGVGTDKLILDPFCGSGTILQEALMMGWKRVVGADISQKAIDATTKNTDWIKKRYGLADSVVRLFQSDVRELSSHFKGQTVDAIITEPYLGPALKKHITKESAQKIRDELEALYFLALVEFTKFLKKGGKVVIAFPVFILSTARGGLMHINHVPKLTKYGYVIKEPFLKEVHTFNLAATTTRGTYVYGRPKQKLWREIIVFEYNATR